MSKIKNLIFDLDGTLIDSSEGVVAAVNYSLRIMGEKEQAPDVIRKFIGYPLSFMYPHFSQKPVAELYRHFQVKAAETIVASTVMLPHVQETLELLQNENYRMGIATTKIKRHVDGIMDKFNWRRLISTAVGGDEVANVKPAPDILYLAMDRMEALPENTVMIGDTVNDIMAAKAVCMKTIAVLSPYGGRAEIEKEKPDFIIDGIDKIRGIIKNNME